MAAPLTSEQLQARERWQARWNLPIILAALLPLFVTSPKDGWVEVAVGVGSWLVFVVDLVVQRQIVPDYLHRRKGKVDVGIGPFTFPYYLIPEVSGASAILRPPRLARVVRLLLATAGLRRFAARLGKVVIARRPGGGARISCRFQVADAADRFSARQSRPLRP